MLANPVLLAIAAVVAVLRATGTTYADYMKGAELIAIALGPTTVALAVPLHAHARQIRGSATRLIVAAALGAATATASAVGIAWLLGAPGVIIRSLAPKSVTTAIAVGISEQIGGIAALTTAIVIFTGIVGAMLGGSVLNLADLHEPRTRGLAIGVASHGIGTAYTLARDETEGAYAGLGMILAGILTGLLLPPIWNALE